jgi:tetratricopeptide (TPR) repeat protein
VRQALEAEADLSAPAAARPAAALERMVRGRLVGRERELDQALVVWQQAAAGQGSTLCISGEPGIGKTRLARELLTRVGLRHGLALSAECYAEGSAPYAPLARIIEQAYENPALRPALNLPEMVLADLAAVAPALRAAFPGLPANPGLDPQSEQQRLFDSMARFVTALAEHQPLLLLIDDAHWADAGSLALLRHLARRAARLRLLLVLTYRETELSEARHLDQVLGDLNRERLAERIKLSRLTLDQAAAMLEAIFSEAPGSEFLDAIYHETEGNPFFIEEICKALVDEGKLYRHNGRWQRPEMAELRLPQGVRVAIDRRIEKLAAPMQDVLRLAAVIGREFDFETLQRSGDFSEDALIDALEAAGHAQLINELRGRSGQVRFSFAHALIPTALREALSTLRLQRLQRRVAAALQQTHPEDYEVIAYHFAQGGDHESATDYFQKSADRAMQVFSFQEAERSYRAVLEMEAGGELRLHALNGLAEALHSQGRAEEALDFFQQTVDEALAQGLADQAAGLYAQMARTAWHGGLRSRVLGISRRGMDALQGNPPGPGLAALLHEHARSLFFAPGWSDHQQVLELCDQALEMARQHNAPEVQADALATRALALARLQRHAESLEAHRTAVEFARAHGSARVAERALNNAASAFEEHTGDPRLGLEYLLRARELTRRTGVVASEIFSVAAIGLGRVFLGEMAQVERDLAELDALLQNVPNPGPGLTMTRLLRCNFWFMCGETERAIQLLSERIAATPENQEFYGPTLGEFLCLQERWEEAYTVLQPAQQALFTQGEINPEVIANLVHVCRSWSAQTRQRSMPRCCAPGQARTPATTVVCG